LGKIPKSIGPQTLLESFYFQILGSLENLSQNLVFQNPLKFAFLPSQFFYNFLGIFEIFPNYFGHPNFLIHFPKNRNQFLMDFFFLFFSSPAGPAHSFGLGLPAGPNRHHHPAHLASWPARPKKPTAPTSSPTSVRSKAAAVAGIAPLRRCTMATMAAPFSRCETPSFLHYTAVVIPLQPEL
jgi:hypothetical protein